MIQKTDYFVDDDKEREYRIQRMEKQLIENQFTKQTYPKKYDYTISKSNYAVPINQLDYKSFYQSFMPQDQKQMSLQNLQASQNKTSTFKLSHDNNKKEVTPNKKQQQSLYRDILQKQVEEKQIQLKQQKVKLECTDLFTNNQSNTPNNKINSLSKSEYQNYLQLQILEKQGSNNKRFDSPNKNLQQIEEQTQDKNSKGSKEFQIIQKQLKQYQEEKQQKDRKLLLQQKFEQSTSIHEKTKEKTFSPENHNRKKNYIQEEEEDKARTQQQKSVVSKILTEQIQEKQKKRNEEKKQQETEDKLAEERWKNEVQMMKEEKKKEEELKKEQQGKIQQENIRMHQLKLKQQEGRNRSKSNSLQESRNEEEFKEELKYFQQEIEEEDYQSELLQQNEQMDDVPQQYQQQYHYQFTENNVKPNKTQSFIDQQNLELDQIRHQMMDQQQQLERQIHAAKKLAQIGLLEGKNRIEKEIVIQSGRNNQYFNEDYSIGLLSKNQSKYQYELPFLFNQKIQRDYLYTDNLLSKVQFNGQSSLMPISIQNNKNPSIYQVSSEQQQNEARSKSNSQHSKQHFHTQLIESQKLKQNDALSQLLLEYHD
ncbi:unnamed protein product (macronuclear) [Paramecium tetraurelia]|uniref:Uncharacterized protein n=1 Tax=Paramecium tetraurelia TaxID=5888 RepID=A0CQP7_PARTE|nr:uncharacterized protein GSPATT00009462001 [Paramecium tetraurelia]CAK73114.1 unnamed protein product [Paramecium tetraurelia]|eukprot:XP_001440511.1 hypothetical protein (macronuclear) [Paramecium tetraurelia strain d4-2]